MKCCIECFKHPWLRDYIEDQSRERGDCSFCSAIGSLLITPSDLSPLFQNLLGMYHEPVPGETIGMFVDPSTCGDPLIHLVQNDWDVFADRLFDLDTLDTVEKLFDELARIGTNSETDPCPKHSNSYCVGRTDIDTMTELWEEFCLEVIHDPWREIKPYEIPDRLFEDAKQIISQGTVLYRSRLGYTSKDRERLPLSGSDMGPPPPEKATAGRANEQYKPVLYCADQEETAIAEVRPARGFLLSVCKITVKSALRILDLSKSVDWPNPFIDENLNYEVEMATLRSTLSWALGQPLERSDSPLDYLATQKLAMLAKKKEFDGIRYQSAMNAGGTNIVLFDSFGLQVEIGESKLMEVSNTRIEYSEAARYNYR